MRTVIAAGATRALATFGVCCILASLAGCGDSTKGTATGKVTYKGQTVTGGTLTLTPSSAGAAPIPLFIKPDGTFSQPDIPVGQYQVSIETASATGPTPYQTGGMTPPGGANVSQPTLPATGGKPVPIPAKYNDPKTSNLSWEIKPGRNDKPFDLTD